MDGLHPAHWPRSCVSPASTRSHALPTFVACLVHCPAHLSPSWLQLEEAAGRPASAAGAGAAGGDTAGPPPATAGGGGGEEEDGGSGQWASGLEPLLDTFQQETGRRPLYSICWF